MIEIFPWSSLLETGIRKIDEQHHRLVDLLNDLARQYVEGEDVAVTRSVIGELADYAGYHFDTEEAIWHEVLPAQAVVSHEAAHQAFRRKIANFQEQPVGSPKLQEDLLGFLVEWLTFHILDTDRSMTWIVLGMWQHLGYEDARVAAEQRRRGEEGHLARTIMTLYRRMTSQNLGLMREREARLRDEHKQDALALQELHTAVRHLADGMAFSELDGTVRFVNHAWARMHQCSEEETIGRHLSVFHSPEQVTRDVEPMLQRLRAEGQATGVVEHLRQDGTSVPTRMSISLAKDANGAAFGMIAIAQDITEEVQRGERERFDQRFRALVAEISARFVTASDEDRFDRALDQTLASLGALFEVDRTYTFRFANGLATASNTHEWCAPGISAQRPALQDIATADTPWWMARMQDHRPLQIEHVDELPPEAAVERARLQAQSIQSLICLPIRDEGHRLIGFIGLDAVRGTRHWPANQVDMLQVIADIVAGALDRRAAARALAESGNHLLRAQRLGKIGSWKFDMKTQRPEWSPETYRLLGIEAGAPLSLESFLEAVYPEDRDRIQVAWDAALRGQPYDIEHRTAHSEGQTWVRAVGEFGGWENGLATVALGTVQDISERKRYEQQLEALAFSDPLTGLANRHGFQQRMEQRLRLMANDRAQTDLYQIDIDGLAQINASMGNPAGDEVLRVVGRRLRAFAGSTGEVARLGGDQFAIAMHECTGESGVADQVQRLQDLLGQPIRLDHDTIRVTACIGSVHVTGNAIDAGPLLRMSDQAIYQAKLGGKSRHAPFDPSQYDSDRSTQDRLNGIRQGLRDATFTLHYQPKVDLLNGELFGLEALIRWQHPEHGLLGPDAFIPYLEGHPLMIELGDWVIDTALAQLLAWQRGELTTAVSVNVASNQLEHPGFADKLAARLSQYPSLGPSRFEVEVLETGPRLELDRAAQTLSRLKAIGVTVSLDDFGTGHSSLQTLNTLGLDIIKIDQSFVLRMLEDKKSKAIVKAVLDLGRTFGLQVVAEGLETPAHGRELIRFGCRYAQGYAIARPMPAEQVPGWLAQWRKQMPGWIGTHTGTNANVDGANGSRIVRV